MLTREEMVQVLQTVLKREWTFEEAMAIASEMVSYIILSLALKYIDLGAISLFHRYALLFVFLRIRIQMKMEYSVYLSFRIGLKQTS